MVGQEWRKAGKGGTDDYNIWESLSRGLTRIQINSPLLGRYGRRYGLLQQQPMRENSVEMSTTVSPDLDETDLEAVTEFLVHCLGHF